MRKINKFEMNRCRESRRAYDLREMPRSLLSPEKIPTRRKNKGNVTTFLALMATSEPLGAGFRPTAPFKVEEKQRRRERVGAIRGSFAGVYRPTEAEVGMVFQSYEE